MVDKDCKYIGNFVEHSLSGSVLGGYFPCKLTNGSCNSDDFNKCVAYLVNEDLEGVLNGNKRRD